MTIRIPRMMLIALAMLAVSAVAGGAFFYGRSTRGGGRLSKRGKTANNASSNAG